MINANIFDMVSDLIHAEVFALSDGSGVGRNIIIFGNDVRLSVHVDNRRKRYLNYW